ncbi:MAG: cation:proton antiporter [Thermoplasmata archaeon]
MISEGELMFQLGAIMLLAFIGAAIAGRINQSVMIGYIFVGVFIGPYISFSVFGFEYHGLITDMELISAMSKIGLILLLFFVGLEFSFSRLMRTRTPAFLLAFVNISMNIFCAFVIGMLFGWPLVDTFFLAGVIAMNSTAIAAKALLDMKRMSNPETELILAFEVIGTFVAMIILTIGSGLVTTGTRQPESLWEMAVGILAFYAFFLVIAIWVVPKVLPHFEKIRSDELFILFALGILFLCAALAELSFVPPIIGAFFVGMIFSESKLAERLEKKLISLKDTFVAIFFISFGMMIDPSYFPLIVPMLLIAVPVVLLNDVIFGSLVTYFMGYSARAATAVGTTIAGRAEESILYASVGSNVKVATKGAELVPFAGAFCFIMSLLTPIMMRRSAKISSALSRILPRSFLFSGALVSRTLSKAILPMPLPLYKKAKKTGGALVIMFITLMAILLTEGLHFWVSVVIGAVIAAMFAVYARREIMVIVRQVNYANLGVSESALKHPVTSLVSGLLGGAIATIYLTAVTWRIYWAASLFVLAGYLIFVFVLFLRASRELEVAPTGHTYGTSRAVVKRIHLPRRHHAGKEDRHAEILNSLNIPKDIRYHSRLVRREVEKSARLRL